MDGEGRLSVYLPRNRERMPGKKCDYARRWFDSMTRRSAYYAKLARRTGCELYCLDSELDRIISFNEEWKQVVAAVRAVAAAKIMPFSARSLRIARLRSVTRGVGSISVPSRSDM